MGEQMANNLNLGFITSKDDNDTDWKRLVNFKSNNVTVHFDEIELALKNYISEANTCLGCVAWLTNENILKTLSKCEVVSIIVQKEDFLRPDTSEKEWQQKQDNWKHKLKAMYNSLPRGISGSDFHDYEFDFEFGEELGYKDELDQIILEMQKQTNIYPNRINYSWGWETEAIRCLGEINKLKLPAFPRMHHKFLVFCKSPTEPYAVWTGSFNFTLNGTQSLENGVFIEDRYIAQAYWYEYLFNFIRSETLNWEAKYKPPKFQIGS